MKVQQIHNKSATYATTLCLFNCTTNLHSGLLVFFFNTEVRKGSSTMTCTSSSRYSYSEGFVDVVIKLLRCGMLNIDTFVASCELNSNSKSLNKR